MTPGRHKEAVFMNETKQYCTMLVDGMTFGIEVDRVQEVLKPQEMTRVPRALEDIDGLLNLRGQIVTAVDLRRRLKLPARDAGAGSMNVIVHSKDEPVSLLVDEIGDVIETESRMYEQAPDNISGNIKDMVTGVYKMADRLLLPLDLDKVLDF